MKSIWIIPVIVSILILTLGFQEAQSTPVIVDFDSVDTSSGLVLGAPVDAYLAGFGITVVDTIVPGGVLKDFAIVSFANDARVVPTSSPNAFYREFGNEPYRYEIHLPGPQDAFSFTRTSYDSLGISIMEWSAQAFDGSGSPLGPTVGEPRQSIFSFFDPRNAPTVFTFPPGTERVDLFRTTINFSAGMAQVPLDNFVITNPSESTAISKEQVSGPDSIGIAQTGATKLTFVITYSGPAAFVVDTVPAEFNILSVSDNDADFAKAGKSGKSATKIEWSVSAGTSTLTVEIETAQSPGHKKSPIWKPTSCGLLPLNDGATAFEVDEQGNLVLVEVVDPETGEITLERVVIVGPSNPLVVEAVGTDTKSCDD